MELINQFINTLTTTPLETVLSAFFLAFLLGVGRLSYKFAEVKIDDLKEEKDAVINDVVKVIDYSEKINQAIEKIEDSMEEIIDNKLNEEGKIKVASKLPHLTENPLFSAIEWQKTILKTGISTGNKGKDLILQEIGIFKLDAWGRHLYKLAEEIERHVDENIEDKCYQTLFDMNIKTFNNAFLEYNNFWHNNPKYTEDEKWCLDHVIKFINEHHQPNVDRTLDAIRYACDSKYYDNCISRESTIFMTYLGALNEFTMEMQRVFNDINGDLKGRIFKGVTI